MKYVKSMFEILYTTNLWNYLHINEQRVRLALDEIMRQIQSDFAVVPIHFDIQIQDTWQLSSSQSPSQRSILFPRV